jgi:hypothetical protein
MTDRDLKGARSRLMHLRVGIGSPPRDGDVCITRLVTPFLLSKSRKLATIARSPDRPTQEGAAIDVEIREDAFRSQVSVRLLRRLRFQAVD